jgi:hypothetical protein
MWLSNIYKSMVCCGVLKYKQKPLKGLQKFIE